MRHNTLMRFARALAALALSVPVARAENNMSASLVRTPPGQLYMADGGRIFQVDTVRQRLKAVTPVIAARNLKVDGQSNVYASSMRYDPRNDLYRPMIWRYNPGSNVAVAVSDREDTQYTFSNVADAEGNLYFWHVDAARELSRILLRPKDGEPILLAGHQWGLADGRGAEARFSRLGGMTVGADGRLYVCDEQCIRRVDRDGTVTTVAQGGLLSLGAGRSQSNHLAALTADDAGNLYAADSVTRRILCIKPDGTVSTLAYSPEEWSLASIAWSDGALYVLESNNHINRVVRITADGQRQELEPHPQSNDSEPPPPLRLSSSDTDGRATFLPMFFMPVIGPLWLF